MELDPKTNPVARRLSKAVEFRLQRRAIGEPWQLYAVTESKEFGRFVGLVSSLGSEPRCP